MKRPSITTIDGKNHDMRQIDGRAYRIIAEFENQMPKFADANFIERHAALVSEFYAGVTSDDILDLPLEEIMPASLDVRNFVINQVWEKTKAIEKNAPEDKTAD